MALFQNLRSYLEARRAKREEDLRKEENAQFLSMVEHFDDKTRDLLIEARFGKKK